MYIKGGVTADLNCAPLHASEKRRRLNQLGGLDVVEMCAADEWLAASCCQTIAFSEACVCRDSGSCD